MSHLPELADESYYIVYIDEHDTVYIKLTFVGYGIVREQILCAVSIDDINFYEDLNPNNNTFDWLTENWIMNMNDDWDVLNNTKILAELPDDLIIELI